MGESKTRTIFIVDDTPANLRLLYEILDQAGYVVRAFPNGQLMLNVMERTKPDLILLDIMMPNLDGYAVCEVIRQRHSQTIPVIFLSALTEAYDKVRAFEVGAQDYITKPIHPQEVLLRLDTQWKQVDERARFTADLVARDTELQEYQEGLVKTLLRLSGLRDNDTGNHIERVQALATTFAEYLMENPDFQVTPLFVEAIRLASPLHDIGKIAIPDAILLKTDKLSEHEWEFMKEHVRLGGEVLGELHRQFPNNYFIYMAMEIALYHHERWDGQGYVHGLVGEEIPLAARIVSIVDVYDALRTVRPYKEAYSHEKALAIMGQMTGAFDPTLFSIFEEHEAQFCVTFESVQTDESMNRSLSPVNK
ncbi:MAG: two-component system response regulator [Methylotenera sp.]|nr:MAG: two-component system response regulator [Methylotenera sp.]